jgi:hypothetical protein
MKAAEGSRWKADDMLKTSVIMAALAMAGLAQAQPYGRDRAGSATLYELPNFQGRSVNVRGDVANLAGYRFNDIAQSARFEGAWRVCEKSDFGGRCVDARGEVADLNSIGMLVKISSLQPAGGFGGGGPWSGGGGGGYGRGDRGIEGSRSVFFPRPNVQGLDVAAGSNGANVFCRNQGLGSAAYFDSSERAPRAIGPEGQFVGSSSVLRDLVCRKY